MIKVIKFHLHLNPDLLFKQLMTEEQKCDLVLMSRKTSLLKHNLNQYNIVETITTYLLCRHLLLSYFSFNFLPPFSVKLRCH